MSTSSKVSVEKHLASLTLTSGPPRKRASSSLSRSKAVSRESTPPLGVEPLLLLLIFKISQIVDMSQVHLEAAMQPRNNWAAACTGLAFSLAWLTERAGPGSSAGAEHRPSVFLLLAKVLFFFFRCEWSSWWDARKLFLLFSAPSKPHTHTLGKALLLLPNTGSVTRFKPLSGMQKENDLRTGFWKK